MQHWVNRLLAAGLGVLVVVHGVVISGEVRAQVAPTYFLVELKPNSSVNWEQDFRHLIQSVDGVSRRAPRRYVALGKVRTTADLRQWRVVEVAADKADQLELWLRQYPAVQSVHREERYQAAFLPNDPRFVATGVAVGKYSPWQLLEAAAAWDVTTGSTETVIAIIDGGVDLTHEDLHSKRWENPGEIVDNGQDDDGNGYVDDRSGWDFVRNAPAEIAIDHGTHVAGIAGAAGNNGVGMSGMDWGARIMSVRVLSGSGVGRETDILQGIEYAVANGADIINLSIVGNYSPALVGALENAYAAGVVVIAAAGNSGMDTGQRPVYPACAQTAAGVV